MHKQKFIYTVTMIQLNNKPYPIESKRTVAWFSKQENAKRIVEINDLDIREGGGYDYAVIEKVPEGTYAMPIQFSDEIWYKWDKKKGKYLLSKKPHSLRWGVGFSIA